MDQIVYYINYFLWLTLPVTARDNPYVNRRYYIYVPVYLALFYSISRLNIVANLLIKLGNTVSFAQYLWPYFNLLLNEGLQLLFFRISLQTDWSSAAANSSLLSVFRLSSFILQDLFLIGLSFGNASFPLQILIRTGCTLIVMLWHRKLSKGVTDIALRDKAVYAAILFLLAVFEYRLRIAYMNSMDAMLGILSIMVPLMVSELIKNQILMNHLARNRERVRITGKYAENELRIMRNYEMLLSKTKHDTLHHFDTIHKMIETENYAQAQKYIETEIRNEGTSGPFQYSENIYVNIVIQNIKTEHPELNIIIDSSIDKNCNVDPLDFGLIALCLVDTPVEKAKAGSRIHLLMHQADKMIIIEEYIDNANIKKELTDTDLMLIKNTIEKYEGSIQWDVKHEGDIVILLRDN